MLGWNLHMTSYVLPLHSMQPLCLSAANSSQVWDSRLELALMSP